MNEKKDAVMPRRLEQIVKRFRLLFCRIFGHSFSPISVIIFQIKTNAINRDMSATIKCRVCGETFVHKDA